MIINLRYRFVFIHVPKSGGTSVASALAGLPGNEFRWLSKYSKHETLAELMQQWTKRRRLKDILLRRSPIAFRKFGFVRNPWDRLCSLYHYMKQQRPWPEIDRIDSFADFIAQAADGDSWLSGLHSLRPQANFFRTEDGGGQLGVDFVGRYERLEEDFAEATRLLRLPNTQLPRKNVSSNSQNDYRNYYRDWMIETVASMFREDIEEFGYEFSPSQPSKRVGGFANRHAAA